MTQEVLVEKLPMYINLVDIDHWNSVIGWAKVVHDTETSQSTIEISLDDRSSALLGNMVEVFDLKAIGFAGIKVEPERLGLRIERPELPWGVHYNLAYDGGGSEWTKYYKTRTRARIAAFWHRNIATWGGTTKLFDTTKEN